MKGTKVKSNKGITLVALVITIIILLILAVVAITAVNGDGIIGKAKEAGRSYNEKAGEENTELARQLGLIEGALGSEEIAEGVKVSDILIRDAKNGLLYQILDDTAKTVAVYGDRGDIDYTAGVSMAGTTVYDWPNANAITTGDVKIPKTVNSNGETYTVTSIGGNAFLDCTSLSNVIIPESVTSIVLGAFGRCTGITEITIPSNVINVQPYVFTGWLSNQKINVYWNEEPENWQLNWNSNCAAEIIYKTTE